MLETCNSQSREVVVIEDVILPSSMGLIPQASLVLARPKCQPQSKYVSRRVAYQNGTSSIAACLILGPIVAIAQPDPRVTVQTALIGTLKFIVSLRSSYLWRTARSTVYLPVRSSLMLATFPPLPVPRRDISREKQRRIVSKNMKEKKNCLVCPCS